MSELVRSNFIVKIKPCTGNDCYKGEELTKRLRNIAVGAIWSKQKFDKLEHVSSVIKHDFDQVFPDKTLLRRPFYQANIAENEVTTHDSERYNPFGSPEIYRFNTGNYVLLEPDIHNYSENLA